MSNSIITVKNLSKRYNITHQRGGYVALRDVLTNIAKKPFSFLKHKAKAAIGMETKEEFWALKDVNFTVERGEAIGIIGANGAGKSTLLKILSKITPPTTGTIEYKGRMSSLLEVGTGFHPELTGRENIFLNGAILGMTKKEIAEKFDDIVEFSGIGKFLDTPVKRYSSGMYVRLAFAVAAHMEPDILVVDEVLAVGDAEFQKKCLGKMDEVTKTAGRTILFVSHNMSAIQNLCKRCILLEGGKIKMIGETKEVVAEYTHNIRKKSDLFINHQQIKNPAIKVIEAKVNGHREDSIEIASKDKEIKIELVIATNSDCKFSIYATLKDRDGKAIGFYSPGHADNAIYEVSSGTYKITASILLPKLARGKYFLDIGVANPNVTTYIMFPLGIEFYFSGHLTETGNVFAQNNITGYQLLDGNLKVEKK